MGSVEGVALSGGETLPARAVVSNASVPATFGEMVPQEAIPADYRKKLDEYKPSISSFIVWLGTESGSQGQNKGLQHPCVLGPGTGGGLSVRFAGRH